jgi:hypothetical protein
MVTGMPMTRAAKVEQIQVDVGIAPGDVLELIELPRAPGLRYQSNAHIHGKKVVQYAAAGAFFLKVMRRHSP